MKRTLIAFVMMDGYSGMSKEVQALDVICCYQYIAFSSCPT